MRTMTALLILSLAALFAPGLPAHAQTGEAKGFLDPFPEGDRYRVQIWGDAMAEGLVDGLAELMAAEPRFQIEKRHRALSGMMRTDADQEARTIDTQLAQSAPQIIVAILGAGDRVTWRSAGNRRHGVGSDEWKEEYQRRLDLVMRAMRKRSVAIFWVGLPIMRRDDVNADAETMNEMFRSRALANGARYIDIFSSFSDADQAYNAHGPDIAGKIRLLREQDGVHFTWAGYRKLAYFVERELKRAAQQAWDERTIPLAGSESEQSRVRPPTTVKLAPLPGASRSGAGTGGPLSIGAAATQPPSSRQSQLQSNDAGGLKADNATIKLQPMNADGREEVVSIEIVRPAIPASVLALVTRRESDDKPQHLGDSVMTEILGGITVVSAVTPLGEGSAERRRASGSNSPLMLVLQRGETLPSKPGRADEMVWPRPETLAALPETVDTPATAAASPPPAQRSPAAKRIRRPPPQSPQAQRQ